MRTLRLDAKPLLPIRLVLLIAAHIPNDIRVALEGQDVRAQTIEEPPVVACDQRDAWPLKQRLFELSDSRITQEGVLVLKAQQHRTQEMNRSDALNRLQEVIDSVATPPKPRRATKPSYGAKQRRLEGKSQRSEIKSSRSRVGD